MSYNDYLLEEFEKIESDPDAFETGKAEVHRRCEAVPKGGTDWTALYRRWVLDQPGTVQITAAEAVDYTNIYTASGLRDMLSDLPDDTPVIGHWTLCVDDDGCGEHLYFYFYLDPTMEDLGIAFGFDHCRPRDLPIIDSQAEFAQWALQEIEKGCTG